METVRVERGTRTSYIFAAVALIALAVLIAMPWWGDAGQMRLVADQDQSRGHRDRFDVTPSDGRSARLQAVVDVGVTGHLVGFEDEDFHACSSGVSWW